jgi:hypothetical protein
MTRNRFQLTSRVSDVPKNAVIHFVAQLIGVITWWLDERSKRSPAKAEAVVRRLTHPAIFGRN